MNSQDFNFKDPSKIPNPIKAATMAAVFVAVIAAGLYLDTKGQREEITALETKEQELRAAFLDKKKQAVNLGAHKKQLVEIEEAFGTLLRQLPNKSEMDGLLNDINQAGVGRGLSFDLFKPAPTELKTDFYAEMPVNISVSGTFSQFGMFSEDVSRLSRIVNLDNVNLKIGTPRVSALDKTKKQQPVAAPESAFMSITAVARTYRYLDPKEIEAQRSKGKPKGKGKGRGAK